MLEYRRIAHHRKQRQSHAREARTCMRLHTRVCTHESRSLSTCPHIAMGKGSIGNLLLIAVRCIVEQSLDGSSLDSLSTGWPVRQPA